MTCIMEKWFKASEHIWIWRRRKFDQMALLVPQFTPLRLVRSRPSLSSSYAWYWAMLDGFFVLAGGEQGVMAAAQFGLL